MFHIGCRNINDADYWCGKCSKPQAPKPTPAGMSVFLCIKNWGRGLDCGREKGIIIIIIIIIKG
jgi:hypothetical protein